MEANAQKGCNAVVVVVVAGLLSVALVACVGEPHGHADESYGELQLDLDTNFEAPIDRFEVSILDISGAIVVERSIPAGGSPNMGPRLVAALPANVPLVIDVLAVDLGGQEIGAGASLVQLAPNQITSITIAVLAHPGPPGIVDGQLSPEELPHREFLLPAPTDGSPGATQELVAGLIDPATNQPIAEGLALEHNLIVGPMYLPEQDGAITALWSWPTPQSFPADYGLRSAHLDSAGRGWMSGAAVSFANSTEPAPVEFGWLGPVVASGYLADQSRWLLAIDDSELGDAVGPPCIRIARDGNVDGDFSDADEVQLLPFSDAARVLWWTAATAVQASGGNANDVAGAIVDTDGDGVFDTFFAVRADGSITTDPWPLANSGRCC